MICGYVFPWPDGRTVPAQVKRLRAAGAVKVYREKRSGAESRVALLTMLDQLRVGDVVLVIRLDHLARSPYDLPNILAAIAEQGARFLIRP